MYPSNKFGVISVPNNGVPVKPILVHWDQIRWVGQETTGL
jgi:hypothetical protein